MNEASRPPGTVRCTQCETLYEPAVTGFTCPICGFVDRFLRPSAVSPALETPPRTSQRRRLADEMERSAACFERIADALEHLAGHFVPGYAPIGRRCERCDRPLDQMFGGAPWVCRRCDFAPESAEKPPEPPPGPRSPLPERAQRIADELLAVVSPALQKAAATCREDPAPPFPESQRVAEIDRLAQRTNTFTTLGLLIGQEAAALVEGAPLYVVELFDEAGQHVASHDFDSFAVALTGMRRLADAHPTMRAQIVRSNAPPGETGLTEAEQRAVDALSDALAELHRRG